MKVSDGFWMTKMGYNVNYAEEVYGIDTDETSVTVYTTHQWIGNRGMTLGGPVLTIRFTSTLETLQPLYRSGQVLTPVDTKVLMRPIMTAEAARDFIAALPDLPPQAPPEGGMRVAKEHYHAVCATYDCAAMAAMMKHTARRRQWALRHGKKVSQLDERFTKRAEDQLYGELAAALSLARDDMETYIRQSYPAWPAE